MPESPNPGAGGSYRYNPETGRAALKPGLLGIIPDTAYAPLEYQGGRIAYAEAGTLLWLDEFTTAYYLSPDRG